METRNIPIHQLLEVLQKEYLVCEIRSKIYPDKHAQYWRDLMGKKKVKIIDISSKNRMLTIFDDLKIKDNFYKNIVPEYGFPEFYYPSKDREDKQIFFDKVNYYKVGKYFKYENNTFHNVAELTFYDMKNETVTLVNEKTGEALKLDCSKISRIL